MNAYKTCYYCAPESKYYMFVDDDFIFNDGWIDEVNQAITLLNNDKYIGAISFINHDRILKHKVMKGETLPRKLNYKEIIQIRKESGMIIRKDIIDIEFKSDSEYSFGEDISKIITTYILGYDIVGIPSKIFHDRGNHEKSWDKMAPIVFNNSLDNLKNTSYSLNRYFKNNILTAEGLSVTWKKNREILRSKI